ncbi:helix-turn-helix domain-containing protein [Lysobacter gummosus]|uniref:helix-turn-helix domain-containing protein n=1 Tax=Lysobacter gummosus TaxID=262324 RepID=UPI001651A3D0
MSLAERVSAARKQARLSQEQLARMLGVSLRSITNWEKGGEARPPSTGHLIELAIKTGVSIVWLVTGQEQGIGCHPLDHAADRATAAASGRPRPQRDTQTDFGGETETSSINLQAGLAARWAQ